MVMFILFAVVSYVTPAGEPRSSGVVYQAAGRGLYMTVAPGSPPTRFPFVFGADVYVPLNNYLSLFGQANFITPNDTGLVTATLGFAFYPGGPGTRVGNDLRAARASNIRKSRNDVVVRLREIWMIQNVEELCPELHLEPLESRDLGN